MHSLTATRRTKFYVRVESVVTFIENKRYGRRALNI